MPAGLRPRGNRPDVLQPGRRQPLEPVRFRKRLYQRQLLPGRIHSKRKRCHVTGRYTGGLEHGRSDRELRLDCVTRRRRGRIHRARATAAIGEHIPGRHPAGQRLEPGPCGAARYTIEPRIRGACTDQRNPAAGIGRIQPFIDTVVGIRDRRRPGRHGIQELVSDPAHQQTDTHQQNRNPQGDLVGDPVHQHQGQSD